MEITDIPKPWRDMLDDLQLLFPDAILVGGALRDRDQGVAVNDLDVFIPAVTGHIGDLENVEKALMKHGWDTTRLESAIYKNLNDTQIVGVLETNFRNCPMVQIIVGPWRGIEAIDAVDFGICQIGYDGRKIHKTQAYLRDKARKEFTIVKVMSDKAFVRTINRWARLKAKYPKWQLNLGTRSTSQVDFSDFRGRGGTMKTVKPDGTVSLLAPGSEAILPSTAYGFRTMRMIHHGLNLQQIRRNR